MTLLGLYDLARTSNVFWLWLPAAMLAAKAAASWRAEYVAPEHRWHYRELLIVSVAALMLIWLAAVQYEATQSAAGPISVANAIMGLFVLWMVARWPSLPAPTSWRRRRSD